MSTLVNVVLLLCGFVVLLYKYSTRNHNFWKNKGVIGPKPIPFFGNYLRFVLQKEYRPLLLGKIYLQYPNEKIIGYYKLGTPALIIKDPEIIKHILVKDFDVFPSRGTGFGKKGLGVNLVHSDGDTWSILRRKISPVFTSAKLKDMLYLIEDRASAFIKYVDDVIQENDHIEVNRLTAKLTAEVIGTCAFGRNIDAFNDDYNKYIDIGKKVFKPTLKILVNFIMPSIIEKLNIDVFSGEIQDFFNKLVRETVEQREGKPKMRRDFMDLLIEMKEQGQITGTKVRSKEEIDLEITESILAAQAFIFFTAGYDTSAATMAFMLYELALNCDIQDRLVEEIHQVLHHHNDKVTYEALNQMDYLDMVLSETLRKYPVVDIGRKSVREYKVPGTDITLSKGTSVIIPTLGLHFDPEHYPDPHRFDPERFSPENTASRNPYVYLPFGVGPRECIGLRFAKLSIKLNIIYFLREFQVTPSAVMSKELEYSPMRVTIEVKGGVWLNIKRRYIKCR